MVHYLQEHDLLSSEPCDRYQGARLVAWTKPAETLPFGYYASFQIGAEWLADGEALVVTPKRKVEHIDFLSMFMTCLSSGLAEESFSQIYEIHSESPRIVAPSLQGVASLLLVVHFLSVVSRIRALKRDYLGICDNLPKVKGRVDILRNDRRNLSVRRYDKIFCHYDVFSADIPENRLIKRALLFAQRIVGRIGAGYGRQAQLRQMMSWALALFEGVSDQIRPSDVRTVKGHKLFPEYREAVRLAQMLLRYYDYNICKVGTADAAVVPFRIDMSLLYEHYVLGLLHEAYGPSVIYQSRGRTGYPDFLYKTSDFRAILDTKYKPQYDGEGLDISDVRQLSGYARDLSVLRTLGFDGISAQSPTPSVPCVIIYPTEAQPMENPFKTTPLSALCTHPVPHLSQFYTISVPLPVRR